MKAGRLVETRDWLSAAGFDLAGGEATYERRRPEEGTLHRVVRENLRTLYSAAEEGFAGAPLPRFVRAELEGYVECGLLQRGFALIACRDSPERRPVAFSCNWPRPRFRDYRRRVPSCAENR